MRLRRWLRGITFLVVLSAAPVLGQTPAPPISSAAGVASSAADWVVHPAVAPTAAAVLHFRREFSLAARPRTFIVHVSADQRFVLYVNGQRAGQGPSRGDLEHWRYQTLDLAPHLKTGANVVAAEVWNHGEAAPLAQVSARTAFYLRGTTAETRVLDTRGGWRVKLDDGRGVRNGQGARGGRGYYVAGGRELIDASRADWTWNTARPDAVGWVDAVAIGTTTEAPPWTLVADELPPQKFVPVSVGKVVRTDLPGGAVFPAKPVRVAAHTTARLLVDNDSMISAYPRLTVSGGAGATINVVYTEALVDENLARGDRNAIGDRRALGVMDEFKPDGAPQRTFATLWWRTWRFAEIEVVTADEPVTLEAFTAYETGYPFEARGHFISNDAGLNRIWDVGWRTVLIDAHETYQDSSYWEQLQYQGDTRLVMLISYGVGGDDRLARQAIDAFGASLRRGPFDGAYPARNHNVIPTYTLLWIGMMHDYLQHRPDTTILRRNLPMGRVVLDYFGRYVGANGLLTRNPDWNFVDWVPTPSGRGSLARDVFPSFDPASGTSCLTTLHYLGALDWMADLEREVGDAARGAEDRAAAVRVRAAVQDQCWDARRGLYADSPAKNVFSQHTNALAVLYDVAPRERASAILRAIAPGPGIDAPGDVLSTSYYFAWYLLHALAKAGDAERYVEMMQTWRDLLTLNLRTWVEQRGNSRSDTHAWTAHPTMDLIGIVAGIQSGSRGYQTVDITPALGGLTSVDAATMTPRGRVRAVYNVSGARTTATLTLPPGLTGRFHWNGAVHVLKSGVNRLTLPNRVK